MERWDETTYGQRISQVYDDLYTPADGAAIETLQALAGEGPVLELGIGTGRVALPLQARGLEVHGVDASEPMVARLREKPGGEAIPVTIGDFESVPVDGRYRLIFIVFNTFYALLTQEAQVRCFRNVADHLLPDGLFVVEAFVPDLKRFVDHQTARVVNLDEDRVQLDVSRHDPVNQQIVSQHVLITEKRTRLYPVKLRYVWPSEFDLMARLAGLTRKHRWGGWDRRGFTAESGLHISVYGREG